MHTSTVLILSVLLSTAQNVLSAPVPAVPENTQVQIDWVDLDRKFNECLADVIAKGGSLSFGLTDCARQNTPSMRSVGLRRA